MPLPIIINAEPNGYSEEARGILGSFAEVHDFSGNRAELLDALEAADGLIVRLAYHVDDDMLAAAPNLRFVSTATTGLNHIDLGAASRRTVSVLSLKGETEFLDTVTATAEHSWALLLALLRHIPRAAAHAESGAWDRNLFVGRELSGLTLGIVGYGRLGRIVADYGKAFRMRTLATDPSPVSRDTGVTYLPLREVVAQADVISVHVALQPDTDGLLGQDAFDSMKPGCYLVNTARGEILDESALLNALQTGRLSGAALDVLRSEVPCGGTWPTKHPLLAYARSHDNLLITPHIAGATSDSMRKTEVFMAEKMRSYWNATL